MLKLILTPIKDCDRMYDGVIQMDDSPIAISMDRIKRLEQKGHLTAQPLINGMLGFTISKELESIMFIHLKNSLIAGENL